MQVFKTIEGFDRQENYRQGSRNHLLILPSVICSSVVCERIADEVDGAVALPHPHGCSQVGGDSEQTYRVLKGFAENPNVGAVLIISLGCEVVDASGLKFHLDEIGKLVAHVEIQDVGGSIAAIQKGRIAARHLSSALKTSTRSPLTLNNVSVALKFGDGRNSFSGNVKYVERFVSDILRGGGTVILGETEKILKGVNQGKITLYSEEKQKLMKMAAKCKVPYIDAREQPLTFKPDLSLGADYPDFSQHDVKGLLSYGEAPAKPGLYIMDSPQNDAECLTGFGAAGVNVVVFFTDRGSSVGNPVVPIIKVAPSHMDGWQDHVDVRLPSQFEEVRYEEFAGFIATVFNGRLTKAEQLGHQEFAIYRIGLSL